MDAGTDEYARMGKNGHTLVGLALELVKEGCHALVLLQETLTACRGLIDIENFFLVI